MANGVALFNDRAIPFDMAARDLDAEVHYVSGRLIVRHDDRLERFADEDGEAAGGAVDAALAGELGRDEAELKKLIFTSGRVRSWRDGEA